MARCQFPNNAVRRKKLQCKIHIRNLPPYNKTHNHVAHICSSNNLPMSHNQYLADLESRALANISKVQQLSATNNRLKQGNAEQEHLIALYLGALDNYKDQDIDSSPNPNPELNSSSKMMRGSPASLYEWSRTPPSPKSTPFYLLARTAPPLELYFVVQGMHGEPLEVPIRMIDMAFVLEQTLKRKGWRNETVDRSVRDWMEVPLVGVGRRGREVEVGVLEERE